MPIRFARCGRRRETGGKPFIAEANDLIGQQGIRPTDSLPPVRYDAKGRGWSLRDPAINSTNPSGCAWNSNAGKWKTGLTKLWM